MGRAASLATESECVRRKVNRRQRGTTHMQNNAKKQSKIAAAADSDEQRAPSVPSKGACTLEPFRGQIWSTRSTRQQQEQK